MNLKKPIKGDETLKLSNFLDQDRFQAMEEINCVKNCLYAATISTGTGDFKSARFMLEQAIRSIDQLECLQKRKNDKNRVQDMKLKLSRVIDVKI